MEFLSEIQASEIINFVIINGFHEQQQRPLSSDYTGDCLTLELSTGLNTSASRMLPVANQLSSTKLCKQIVLWREKFYKNFN